MRIRLKGLTGLLERVHFLGGLKHRQREQFFFITQFTWEGGQSCPPEQVVARPENNYDRLC